MGGNNSDRDGFPNDILEQMRAGHNNFMRELSEEIGRFQQDLQKQSKQAAAKDKNIFVSFKHFIDNNLDHLAQSFRNLPANIAEIRAGMRRDAEAKNAQEQDIWRRWTGSEDSPDYGQMLKDRRSPEEQQEARKAALLLLTEAYKMNLHVPPEKIEALYADSESPWRGETFLGIKWFKRNPYSPIRLEAHPDLSISGSQWRAAFEDLINATLDKPMTYREQWGLRVPHGRLQSTQFGPGLDWMLSLQCRGILPAQLPGLYNQMLPWEAHGVGKSNGHGRAHDNIAITLMNDGNIAHNRPRGQYTSKHSQIAEENILELAKEISTPPPPAGALDSGTEKDLYDELAPPKQCPYPVSNLTDAASKNLQTLVHDEASGIDRCSLARKEQHAVEEAWFNEQRRLDAVDELNDALEKDHVEAVQRCLKSWYEQNGSVSDLIGACLEDLDFISHADVARILRAARCGMKHGGERLKQEAAALGIVQKNIAAPSQSEPANRKRVPAEKVLNVDVLSSLTTTQTTRLPDGTVTMKVVLKQRFADGREEMEEKVHTYQEWQSDIATQTEVEATNKKGWFWT